VTVLLHVIAFQDVSSNVVPLAEPAERLQPGMLHYRLSVRCIMMLQRKCSAAKLVLNRLRIGIGRLTARNRREI